MIRASLIYIAVTILLALVDAIRIRIKYGKQANIDHELSSILAILIAGPLASICILQTELFGWIWLLRYAIIFLGLMSVRFATYDIFINFFRILTKTNPSMRLDYVSDKTSSYEDQHSEKIGFWQKRGIGIAAWFIIWIIYCKIF